MSHSNFAIVLLTPIKKDNKLFTIPCSIPAHSYGLLRNSTSTVASSQKCHIIKHYEEESKSSPDSRDPPSHVIRSYLIGLIIAPIAFVSLTVIGYVCEESNDTIGFPMKIVGLTLLGVYFFMTGTLAVIAAREFYKGKGAVYWATYEFSGSKWFHVCAIAFMMSMLGFALVVAAFILALVE